jgi:hypothetical protein
LELMDGVSSVFGLSFLRPEVFESSPSFNR